MVVTWATVTFYGPINMLKYFILRTDLLQAQCLILCNCNIDTAPDACIMHHACSEQLVYTVYSTHHPAHHPAHHVCCDSCTNLHILDNCQQSSITLIT
jgi:hypothetical protein